MSTARERARSELTADILAAARTQLGAVGPAALSLRAVARAVDLVSSAVYRYYASRDELLTALLVQCYDELGAAVEAADAAYERQDFRGRWRGVCGRIRSWATEHPHEYALLYGSPVPGYAAPETTIGPASRPTLVLVRIVVEAHAAAPTTYAALSRAERANVRGAREFVEADHEQRHGEPLAHPIEDELVVRVISAWTHVFGTVSFEVFGHLVGSVVDYGLFFAGVVEHLADTLDLPA